MVRRNPVIKNSFSRRSDILLGGGIAVVVVCHNYGRFLGECLESILAQSLKADEILVVDDSSTDNTPAVAAEYERVGVRYVAASERNVHKSRQAGFDQTTSEILCFLDADDYLSADYLKAGYEVLQSTSACVAYSDVQKFGNENAVSNYREEFCRDSLACDNYIHAGSLVRRDAILLSGAFDQAIDPLLIQADWFLWRKVLSNGCQAAKQPGLYYYRQHGDNWMRSMRENARGYYEYAGLMHETVTLGIALSGRLEIWDELKTYLESQEWPHSQVRLVLLDTSASEQFGSVVQEWSRSSDYPDIRYIRQVVGRQGLANDDRHQESVQRDVRLAMARIYSFLSQQVTTDYAWFLEDDVIPPRDACRRLLQGFDPDTASVSGVYLSRFDHKPCVWDQHRHHYEESGPGLRMTHGNGFGCVMLRRAVLTQRTFASRDDFDRVFYDELATENWTCKVDWGLVCAHLGRENQSPCSASGCQCLQPGWCDRHQITKSQQVWKLCQSNPSMFELWESRARVDTQVSVDPKAPMAEPGLARKAWNLGKAVTRHVLDGARRVSDNDYHSRLETCRGCAACDIERMVCREKSCGCQLHVKARWHSESCPQGRWQSVESVST